MYQHCYKMLIEDVQESDIVRKIDSGMVNTVPGFRKLHHLRVLAPNVLATRQHACFCAPCIAENYSQCLNKQYVDGWETVKLEFKGPSSLLASLTSSVDQQAPPVLGLKMIR